MFENILGKLNVFKITVDDLNKYCIKDNNKISIGRIELFNDIYLSSYNKYFKDINKIKVKSNGLYYDVDTILVKICKIFGIDSFNTETLENQKDKFRSINNINDIKAISEDTYKEFLAFCPDYIKLNFVSDTKLNSFKVRMIKNIDKLIYINQHLNEFTKLNDSLFNIIDMKKLEVFLNFKIVRNMQEKEFNDDLAERCLSTVATYLEKNNNANINIKIDKDYINNIYMELLKKYKKEEPINKDNSNINNFFEVDKNYNEYKEPDRKITKYISSKEEEKRKNGLIRKITFYNNLDVIKKHIGNNSYKGYVGYELATGKVILDKLYNDEDGKSIAYGEAIYIVKVGDLTILNNHSKTEVISKINNRDLDAIRILHSNNWEEKVNNAIKK